MNTDKKGVSKVLFLVLAAVFLLCGLFFALYMQSTRILGLFLLAIGLLLLLGAKKPKLSSALLLLLLFGTALCEIPIVINGKSPPLRSESADYVIVLGAAVYGTVPSPSLTERLDSAFTYLSEHPFTTAVVSGGQGKGEEISEASAMRQYLMEKGIDPSRIIEEPLSKNTRENLRFSFSKIEEAEAQKGYGRKLSDLSVLIISSEYHIFRAKYIARTLGVFPDGLGAPTKSPLIRINYYLREIPALAKAVLQTVFAGSTE